MTLQDLRRKMTEYELRVWRLYLKKRRFFPTRRLEFMLANLARLTHGGNNSLYDFLLFDRQFEEPVAGVASERAAHAISMMTGSRKVVKLGEVIDFGKLKRAAGGR